MKNEIAHHAMFLLRIHPLSRARSRPRRRKREVPTFRAPGLAVGTTEGREGAVREWNTAQIHDVAFRNVVDQLASAQLCFSPRQSLRRIGICWYKCQTRLEGYEHKT